MTSPTIFHVPMAWPIAWPMAWPMVPSAPGGYRPCQMSHLREEVPPRALAVHSPWPRVAAQGDESIYRTELKNKKRKMKKNEKKTQTSLNHNAMHHVMGTRCTTDKHFAFHHPGNRAMLEAIWALLSLVLSTGKK